MRYGGDKREATVEEFIDLMDSYHIEPVITITPISEVDALNKTISIINKY
jgi:hypothetical protein